MILIGIADVCVTELRMVGMKLAAIQNSSIRVRLSILIILNSGLALLLASIALFGYESYLQRQAATRELSASAGILAENVTAALSFNDERAATQILSSLRGDPNIIESDIYDRNGLLFARYRLDGALRHTPTPPRPAGSYFDSNAVTVFQPITLAGDTIGTISLKSNNDVNSQLKRYIGIVCLVMLLSLALSLLLASGAQKNIADPITALSAVARRVSEGKNYSVRAARNTGGEIGVLVDSFNDMLSQIEVRETARRIAEESLRESEERYALAARGANDGLWDWKLDANEIYFSPRWNQMLGYSELDPCPAPLSTPEDWFSRIHPSDRERFIAEVADVREGRKSELTSEYRMRNKNDGYLWVLTRGIAIRDETGTAVRMAGSQTDITEGKIGDPLTALPNRLYFIDRLESSISTSARNTSKGRPPGLFAVLFLDLDKFKLVNDSLGHAAGNELLMGVALRLRLGAFSTVSDLNGQPPVVARLGGDEFAILLYDVRDERDPIILAERIIEKLKAPFPIEGRQMFASVSIGIALSSSADTPEDLMRNADTAMYQAKAKGKSRFEVFDQRMRDRAVARLETETDLRKAIDDDQLVLYYQPEVSLSDHRTIGYEALVRWNHPVRGILAPAEFIPVAEESDLIIHLGRWVLKQACRQMAGWQSKFFSSQPLAISVNVSPRQLSDPRLLQDVEDVLAETGLNPRCLNLEVTESSIMGNPENALATLHRLKSLNVGLEIDDFGTGYSSLSCLHLLPFDTVKIDRSFIQELGAGEGSEIVRTILALARSLDMDVVAEGVETQDQVHTLTQLGCHCAQGFYFSKPKSAQMTEELLAERAQLRHTFELLHKPASPVHNPQQTQLIPRYSRLQPRLYGFGTDG
jgi:diguanylate cyclase (GGDEF)-like protein/PAS domain S-box-containing protein